MKTYVAIFLNHVFSTGTAACSPLVGEQEIEDPVPRWSPPCLGDSTPRVSSAIQLGFASPNPLSVGQWPCLQVSLCPWTVFLAWVFLICQFCILIASRYWFRFNLLAICCLSFDFNLTTMVMIITLVWKIIIKVVMMILMIWMIISAGSLTEERKGGSHRQAMTLPLIVIAAITTIIICLSAIAQNIWATFHFWKRVKINLGRGAMPYLSIQYCYQYS